eukprot:scpid49127/ scgid29698/ 
MAGMLVADGGRGRVTGLVLISMSCSKVNGWLLTGSFPVSPTYFSIRRRSKTQPETGERTGCSGTTFEREQYSSIALYPTNCSREMDVPASRRPASLNKKNNQSNCFPSSQQELRKTPSATRS